MKDDIVIVGAARTAVGAFNGALAGLPAHELGKLAITSALKRAGVDPGGVSEVIMGNCLSAGLGQAPARQAALGGGIPAAVGCTTLSKMCGSGMKAVMLGHDLLLAGSASVVVAGGMESMTNAPYLLKQARAGYRMGHGELLDSMILDGLWCAFDAVHMGAGTEV